MNYGALLLILELGVVVAMIAASELGFRGGMRRHSRKDRTVVSEIGVARAMTFGILGVLIAFTISMAQDRFLVRRQLILDEANAIGTTYLRSRYLAQPHADELAPLFRRYVAARVAFYEAGGDTGATQRATEASDRIQGEIWSHTIRVARDDPMHGDTIAAYVTSLNEMIDLEDARVAALVAHVPFTVMGLVVFIGIVTCAMNGFAGGLQGRRAWLSVTLVPLLVAIAACVMLDLDSPRVGIVTTGQLPMLRLQETLAAEAREPALETPVAASR